MATFRVKVKMDCTDEDYDEVISLGDDVDKGIYVDWTAEYTNPPLSKLAYEAILEDARSAVIAAHDGGTTAKNNRKTKVKTLYDLLSIKYITYVNGLYTEDFEKLAHSGFSLTKEPETHLQPSTPIIKKIINGVEANSCRIILSKRTGSEVQRTEKVIYFLWKTTDPSSMANLTLVCTTTNKHKLIAKNLTLKEDVYYMVSTKNANSESELSGRVKFTLV